MIIREVTDANEIKKVLCHPDVYERINDDHCPPSERFTPPDWARYIAGYAPEIIGVMIFHGSPVKCHIGVLPEHKGKAFLFAKRAIQASGYQSLYAEIPNCYQNVIEFSKYLGFKQGETKPDDFLKNGELFDVTVMRLENGICKRRS